MNHRTTILLWAALAATSQFAGAGADHPELSAADQAYSAENYEAAARLYRRDAELGVVAAQANLAFMFLDGLGVAQDFAQAAQWFQRAAQLGNAEAQQNLGVLYREGKGVSPNAVEAAKWFRIAGANGDLAEVEKSMTPEQVGEARRLAETWTAEHKRAPR